MSSSIKTPHATGSLAVTAFCFCLAVNAVHFYLSKTSKRRQTLFGKRLIVWSHGSMILTTLAPLFMIFSYFHPERIFGEDVCACQAWFAFAVISFATGLYLLKINYLVRLNMVVNPGNTSRCSNMLGIYLTILIIEMIVINIIQYLVIYGECMTDKEFGCVAGFSQWNGWMATGVLVHDMVLYYIFCVYYIRRVKAKLGKKVIESLASRIKKDVSNLQMEVRQTSPDNSSNNNMPSSDNSNDEESKRINQRSKLVQEKERHKLKLVYKGLIRQFRITLLAIGICAFDLMVNTIWMDYNMLWLFMIDSCVVVILNFLAFRDSHYFIMNTFEWFRDIGCESCSVFVDVCFCMREETIDKDITQHNETSTTGTSTTNTSTATTNATNNNNNDDDDYEKDGTEDSFLRYHDNDEQGVEITAIPQ